jgi:peptidoglycan/LPS O-acetylase OafA/YrhL
MIRLFPSIIVASLFTFFFFVLFDNNQIFPNSHVIKNFIPSISFINPSIFNNIFHTNLQYLNGSYWSLWPEVQFYFISSCIYFLDKKRFVLNFMITSIILISTNYIMQNILGSNMLNIEISENILTWYKTWIYNGFNLINYLPFFSIGIIMYILYENNKEGIKTSLFLKLCISFIILYTIYSGVRLPVRLAYIFMISLFFVFIYLPEKLSIFENSKITNIGESSYFLYLIHENLGVFIIYTLGQYILPNSFIVPTILIIGLSYLSVLFTNKIDKPINNLLKKKITKH